MTAPVLLTPDPRRSERRAKRDAQDRAAAESIAAELRRLRALGLLAVAL